MDDNQNKKQPNPTPSDYQKILDEYAASVKPDTAQPPENLPEEKIPVDSLKETISLPPEPKKIAAQTPEKTLADDLEEAIVQKKQTEVINSIPASESPIHPSLAVNLEENDTVEQKPITTPIPSIPKIDKPIETVSEIPKIPSTEAQTPEPGISPPEKTPEEIKAEINRLLTDDETKSDNSDTTKLAKKSSIGKVFFVFALILFLAVTTGLAYFLFLVPSNTNNANKNTTNSVPTSSVTPTTAPVDTSGTCELNDKTYQVGESFQSADGCNTCSCSSAGIITCTEKACTGTSTATKSANTAKTTVTPTKTTSTSSTKTIKVADLVFSLPKNWSLASVNRDDDNSITRYVIKLLTDNKPYQVYALATLSVKTKEECTHSQTITTEYGKVCNVAAGGTQGLFAINMNNGNNYEINWNLQSNQPTPSNPGGIWTPDNNLTEEIMMDFCKSAKPIN